jgi:hypothetical protein
MPTPRRRPPFSKVDPASVRLERVAAQTVRQVTVKDVATPCIVQMG